MTNEDGSFIVGAVLGGLIGYSTATNKIKGWDEFTNRYNKRLNHLAYLKIIIPSGFFDKVKNGREIYAEGVSAYLFGLPNASIPMILRCLEIGLKHKHKEVESRSNPKKLYKLIEWSEGYLGNKKELAHGFRILRNLIHEEKIVKEQDIPECIRHTSEMLNILFPFNSVRLSNVCAFCKKPYEAILTNEIYWLGNVTQILCNKCQRVNNMQLIP